MGLRAKVVFGLVVFIVIFGLRFMCVNCQQVVGDVAVAEDHIQQPQPAIQITSPRRVSPTKLPPVNVDEGEDEPSIIDLSAILNHASAGSVERLQQLVDGMTAISHTLARLEAKIDSIGEMVSSEGPTQRSNNATAIMQIMHTVEEVEEFEENLSGLEFKEETAWQQPHPDPTQLTMDSEITVSSSYQSPTAESAPPAPTQTGRRRRRPGGRKRRRRPQGQSYQSTESNEYVNYSWQGQIHDDSSAINDSDILSTYNSTDLYSSAAPSSSEEIQQQANRRLLIQPQSRIEKVREPLAALEQEQRLSDRREKYRKRVAAVSSLRPVSTTEAPERPRPNREFYLQRRRPDTSVESTSRDPPKSGNDLKDILKNSGGLSLSEILQQKNLSLDDLIKGKQNALLALQTPAPTTSDPNGKYVKPIRRIPISYLTSPTTTTTTTTTTRAPTTTTSTTTTTTTTEPPFSELEVDSESTPHERVSSTQNTNSASDENLIYTNDFFSHGKGYYPSSQASTLFSEYSSISTPVEADDFSHFAQQKVDFLAGEEDYSKPAVSTVPTRPSYRKRMTIKPTHKISSSIKQHKDSSSSSESGSHERHYNHAYRDNNSSSQESLEEKLSQKDQETNFIEKFATFEEAKPKDVTTIEELFRPLYQKKDSTNLFETITSRVDIIAEKHFNKATSKSDVTESIPSLFTDIDGAEEVDDRTDLLELLEDRRSGNRLFKVLAQRNMTLDELIQHRQRGSSQLHFSQILSNKTRKTLANVKPFSIKPQVLNEKLDIVTAFDNFPQFNLGNVKSIKPDDIKTDSEGSSYFTSIINIKPTGESQKEGREMKSLSFDSAEPTTFVASGEDKAIDFYAEPWKSFAIPISYSSQENANNYIDQPAEASAQISPPEEETADKFDTAAQIEDEVARAHDILDLELSGHGLRRSPIVPSGEIPMGVRSAVIASSLIVIFSLAIFLVIFIVCRWKQRRRKKLTYIDNYNAMKQTRLPIISTQSTMKRLEPPQMTVATVTGGNPLFFTGSKNNKINTMDPNSPEVQEYLFDAMRKPF